MPLSWLKSYPLAPVLNCVAEKYSTFSGRAGRWEFWGFRLFAVILLCIALGIEVLLLNYQEEPGFGAVFLMLADFALFIPSLSVAVRRLHDTGRSGWWWLLLVCSGLLGIVLLCGLSVVLENSTVYLIAAIIAVLMTVLSLLPISVSALITIIVLYLYTVSTDFPQEGILLPIVAGGIAMLGPLTLVWFYIQPGDVGANRYGEPV